MVGAETLCCFFSSSCLFTRPARRGEKREEKKREEKRGNKLDMKEVGLEKERGDT